MKRVVADQALKRTNRELRKLRARIEDEQTKEAAFLNDPRIEPGYSAALLQHLRVLMEDGLRHRTWLEEQLGAGEDEDTADGRADQTGGVDVGAKATGSALEASSTPPTATNETNTSANRAKLTFGP